MTPRLVIGGCCVCIAAGGVVGGAAWLNNSDSGGGNPPPTFVPPPTAPEPEPSPTTIPEPNPGFASPVFGTPTAADVPRAAAQLPALADEIRTVDGDDALQYVNYIQRLVPGTNWYLHIVEQVVNCAMTDGLLAGRAYFGGPYTATGVVVLSSPQGRSLSQLAYDCARTKLAEAFGGPDGFHPCADAYWYDAADGFRYFVFVASTQTSECWKVRAFHREQNTLYAIWSYGLN